MRASLRDSGNSRRPWEWNPRAIIIFLRSQEFYDATIQSVALYTLASVSLPVTFLIDTNIVFYVNVSVLSSLMVRSNSL